jgi:4a-hydroxytetrahydrobiopterin dehydratase
MTGAKVAEAMAGVKGWKLVSEGGALSKQFTMKDHVAAVGFVVKVATVAETLDHHPQVDWVYNKVTFTLSTHDAGGLTPRDFELAAKIDSVK